MTLANRVYSYILPGQAPDARVGLTQAAEAERIGLGGVFVSERWESKELGTVLGALTQATSNVQLVAGLTHFGTRHPVVQAGMGQTMQTLSGGRFVLGYGRGIPSQFKKLGIPVPNMQGMADYVGILRKLWAGETVSYSGSAGDYPEMQLAHGCDNPPPIIIGTSGPKTLALAGAHFDGVVLHPFLTAEGVSRAVAIVRKAADEAGRDPYAIKFYVTVVTAPDTLTDPQRADILEARAISYFMHRAIGTPIVKTNGWSEEPMNVLADTGLAKLEYGTGTVEEKRRAMADAANLLPREWLETGAATGSIANCVKRLNEYLAVGVDHILLHGTTPDMQDEIIAGVRQAG